MRGLATAVGVATAMLALAGPAVAGSPIVVQTSVSPQSIYVADVVTARVDVLVDRRQVNPGSVEVTSPFGAWQQLQPTRSTSTGSSTIVRRTWWFTLACISERCVPGPKAVETVDLPALTVAARTVSGTSLVVRHSWPAINIAGRYVPPNLHALIFLQAQTEVPPATYRFGPGWLAGLLDGIGSALIAAAVGLSGLTLMRWRAARRIIVDTRPPLVRSLALVRQAQQGGVEERRRAVGLLARVLPQGSQGLLPAALEVAWSVDEPSADDLEELARQVEAEFVSKA